MSKRYWELRMIQRESRKANRLSIDRMWLLTAVEMVVGSVLLGLFVVVVINVVGRYIL